MITEETYVVYDGKLILCVCGKPLAFNEMTGVNQEIVNSKPSNCQATHYHCPVCGCVLVFDRGDGSLLQLVAGEYFPNYAI